MLAACTHLADAEDDQRLTRESRKQWSKRAKTIAGEGLRVLAMADKRVDRADVKPYSGLGFVGLVRMAAPPRDDISLAIEACQRAGIRVVMVTGDRSDTGEAIGEQIGLALDGSAVHGSELGDWEQFSDKDRTRVLASRVFARVTPAKQMADMVLRDDQFSTIVEAVRQGRIIFANTRKSVVFMLCTNLAEILVVTLASLAQAPISLLPLQVLFLNVVTDVFPALALDVGMGDRDVMDRPPRDPRESVLTPHHWFAIGGWSLVIGTCVLGALALALSWLGFTEQEAITVSFLTLAFAKLWFVLNLRDQGAAVWNNDVVRNLWIWGSLVLSAGLLLLAVYWSPLSGVLQTERPGGSNRLARVSDPAETADRRSCRPVSLRPLRTGK